MQLETSLKNHTIAVIVNNNYTDLNTIFEFYLNHYKEFKRDSGKYKNEMKIRLQLKQNFDGVIARNYVGSPIIQHYVHNNKSVPLWAIFELITLGDYGNFLICLDTNTRLKLEEKVGIVDKVNDTDGSMLPRHVFIIKELRNAIAHNSIVFDCRFKGMRIKNSLKHQLELATNISNINFDSIVDYLILIIYYQKGLRKNRTTIRFLVKEFRILINDLKLSINKATFDKILGTDVYNKLNSLNRYI